MLVYFCKFDVFIYLVGDRVYFSLLFMQVIDKNMFFFFLCDFLIDIVLDYYIKKDGVNWVKVWFYKGWI